MWMWPAHMLLCYLLLNHVQRNVIWQMLSNKNFKKKYSVNDEDTNFFTMMVKIFTIFSEKSISIEESLCQGRTTVRHREEQWPGQHTHPTLQAPKCLAPEQEPQATSGVNMPLMRCSTPLSGSTRVRSCIWESEGNTGKGIAPSSPQSQTKALVPWLSPMAARSNSKTEQGTTFSFLTQQY